MRRFVPTALAAVSLLAGLFPPGTPVVLAGLPPGNPPFLGQTDACEDTLDRSDELTLSGFTVSETGTAGALSDVEVSAHIENSDVGKFARASAIPDFTGTGLDVETVPALEPMAFGAIAPNGGGDSATPMTLRLPTSQVSGLEAALDNGDIDFVIHAREELVV